MLDLRAPGLGRVTPDGKRLFFPWNITGTTAVWRLDAPKGFPVQVTGGEDRTALADITPDGKLLVLSRDLGGQEDPGLYLQPVGGGPLRTIQHKKGSRAFYAFTQDDARTLWFMANDVKPDRYAIHRYGIASGRNDVVFDEPGLWSIADHREEAGEVTLLLSKATGALQRGDLRVGPEDQAAPPAPRPGRGRRVRRGLRGRARRAARPHQQARGVAAPLPLPGGQLHSRHSRDEHGRLRVPDRRCPEAHLLHGERRRLREAAGPGRPDLPAPALPRDEGRRPGLPWAR